MRYSLTMRNAILACLALILPACTSQVATVSRSDVAAGRYAALDGGAAVDPGVPLMVYAVGPNDVARAALFIPPEIIGCGGDWLSGMIADGGARTKTLLMCVAAHITTPPAAGLHYATYPTLPKAAAPCAPPRSATPCAPPPAKAPGCEPVAVCDPNHPESCAVASAR